MLVIITLTRQIACRLNMGFSQAPNHAKVGIWLKRLVEKFMLLPL